MKLPTFGCSWPTKASIVFSLIKIIRFGVKLSSASTLFPYSVVLWIPHASGHLKNCTQDVQPESIGRGLDANLEARLLPFIQWPLYSEQLKPSDPEVEATLRLSVSLLPSWWAHGLFGRRGNPRKPQWGEGREWGDCFSSQALSSWAADTSVICDLRRSQTDVVWGSCKSWVNYSLWDSYL